MSTKTTVKTLERAAIRAYQAGTDWPTFWRQWGPHAVALEPHDRRRFNKLVRKLTMLLTCGDTDGMEPAGEPWLANDESDKPADSGTAAKIDWRAAGVVQLDLFATEAAP